MPQKRKILFISKRATAPSSRYRALQYASLFEQAGWKFIHIADDRTILSRKNILYEANLADIVVILRRTYSYPFIKLLRSVSKVLVFDFDDAVFRKNSGEKSYFRNKNFSRIVKWADQVWAGNGYLADKARKHNKHVVIIPTTLDIKKYNIIQTKPRNTFDLVWIGSSSTKEHLLSILPALERSAKLIPSLRLKIIADFTLQSELLTIVPVSWSEWGEAAALASSHIGIAPLPDNLFTKGKCALKVIQYMAAALPVISSPTGVNEAIIQPFVNGLLAGNTDEWVDAISKLFYDSTLREQFGTAGKKMCEKHFTIQSAFMTMQSSIKEALLEKK
jgi:glycosyltransferase involved in cell wall biosynthesis